jgi:hypothetical protein
MNFYLHFQALANLWVTQWRTQMDKYVTLKFRCMVCMQFNTDEKDKLARHLADHGLDLSKCTQMVVAATVELGDSAVEIFEYWLPDFRCVATLKRTREMRGAAVA